MKYISFLLVFSLVFLVSCFEKKVEVPVEPTDTVTIDDVTLPNNPEEIPTPEPTEETPTEPTTEETPTPDEGTLSGSVSGTGETSIGDEALEGYEEDLEALFRDILGDE